ncbi:MAG: TetR/AcrR family transcriptional regulator [Mycobacterium sp.]
MLIDEPTPRGRPRDPRTHRDITDATRHLLVRDGYDQVSMDAIAREAGVSRPTVYRRWPSKAHVVFDAAFGESGAGDDVLSGTGDFDADLREFVRAMVEFWREPVVEAATLGILAERRRDPELHIRTQQMLDQQTLSAFTALVQTGIDAGRLRPDLDITMLYELLVGTTFYSVLVQQHDDVAALVESLCSLVLRGALREEQP